MFAADVDLTGVTCAAVIDAEVADALAGVLVAHFVEIARNGYQFERFEDAWCAWAEADAAIDWTEERLQDTVLEILTAGLVTAGVDHKTLCTCAATILAGFGTHFREWMDGKLAAGAALDQLDRLRSAGSLALCPDLTFQAGVAAADPDAVARALRHATRRSPTASPCSCTPSPTCATRTRARPSTTATRAPTSTPSGSDRRH